MSSFIQFPLNDLGNPHRVYSPLPERQLEGNQICRNWNVDKTEDEKVATGVWEVTPGAYRSMKQDAWELCVILSGVSEITEDGGETVTVRAGDSFVLKPGFVGTWRVLETTRKIWVLKN
ncbi:cupin domain-containing protein [Paraburkholderia tropica]|uniref:cupin domain-containing protein n=1 Tax=Paraburkholderia tropica TaxID=92647 RepID=UPI002AB0DDC3|nr:cupin domain-containing protein [Paraburkholderia tropica]